MSVKLDTKCIECKYSLKCPKLRDMILKFELEGRGINIGKDEDPLDFIGQFKRDYGERNV
jgi:hypothetical protein